MAKWRKRFNAWAAAKQPIATEEVEAVLTKVFGARVREHKGGSHRWTVDVPELVDAHADFSFGQIGFPVHKGQTVKAKYCQIAYEAALLLGLPEEDNEEPEEDN